MDNVFMLNGTLFVVTDDPSFPPLDSIASNPQPSKSEWQILSSAQARETLGSFGGLCVVLIHPCEHVLIPPSSTQHSRRKLARHGRIAQFVLVPLHARPCSCSHTGNYTLFSLWRTYSTLDTSLSPDTLTLPPPRRVIYPYVPTFMGEQPDLNGPIVLRERSPSGFHPFLVKAAFPTLGLLYREDWADYALLHVPFLMQRVVVADKGAARRARTDVPPFAVPLVALEAASEWWEPVRRHVARFVGVAEQAPKQGWLGNSEAVVTYLSRQEAVRGPRLREADHEALVKALGTLEKGYRVHAVSAEASWMERMTAIAQSTVRGGLLCV